MEDFETIRMKILFKVVAAKDLIQPSKAYISIPQGQEGLINLPPNLNKTKHSNETLNPIWNESFILEFYRERCTKFKIEIYNHTSIGKDKLIGSGDVPLNWMTKFGKNLYDEWIPISIEKSDKKTKEKEATMQSSVHVIIKVLGTLTKNDKEALIVDTQLPLHFAKTFKPFKTGDPLPQNTTIALTDSEYTIDFGWDKPNFEFETGFVAFDLELKFLDKVYYFRPSCFDNAIKHSGEDVPNNKQKIQISLKEIPENVDYLAVILYSENEISFDQAKNIYISLSSEKGKIGKCVINKTEECFGLLLGIFQKDPDLKD